MTIVHTTRINESCMKKVLMFFMVFVFMTLSADEPVSPYDIPGKPEMEICSCVEEAGYYDPDEPFFITVVIANFGKEVLENVKISLMPGVECVIYLPQTSEISKRDSFSENHKWEKVPDSFSQENKIAEIFPFTENFKIADALVPCQNESSNCENIMIRFQHHVYGACPKFFAQFQAVIADDTGRQYKTNSSVPLKIKPGTSENSDCYIAPQDQCGGHSFTRPEEISDEDDTEDADMVETTDSGNKKPDGCSSLIL